MKIFAQNHELRSLGNFMFGDYLKPNFYGTEWLVLKSIFLYCRKAFYLSETSPNTISSPISPKKVTMKNLKFLSKLMD